MGAISFDFSFNKMQELNQKCTYKKTNWIGKLVFLVILGLSGMYICISGVDRGVMYHKHSTELAITRKSRTKEACMKSETVPLNNIFVHYPQPSTYDRYTLYVSSDRSYWLNF